MRRPRWISLGRVALSMRRSSVLGIGILLSFRVRRSSLISNLGLPPERQPVALHFPTTSSAQ